MIAAAVGERVEQAESAWERHSWLPPCDFFGDGGDVGGVGVGLLGKGNSDDDDCDVHHDGDGDDDNDDGEVDHVLANTTSPSSRVSLSPSTMTTLIRLYQIFDRFHVIQHFRNECQANW